MRFEVSRPACVRGAGVVKGARAPLPPTAPPTPVGQRRSPRKARRSWHGTKGRAIPRAQPLVPSRAAAGVHNARHSQYINTPRGHAVGLSAWSARSVWSDSYGFQQRSPAERATPQKARAWSCPPREPQRSNLGTPWVCLVLPLAPRLPRVARALPGVLDCFVRLRTAIQPRHSPWFL